MLSVTALLLCSLASPITAIVKSQFPSGVKGFNYDAHDDFATRFPQAKALGFDSARTFTAIAPPAAGADPNNVQPLGAFQAAHDADINLLVGLYLSAGQDAFNNELKALEAAITNPNYGSTLFPSKIIGITVGNEDLYRNNSNDPTKLGAGDSIENIITYIGQTRDLLKKHNLDTQIPIGHAETWSEWESAKWAAPVMPHLDYIALNSFPYWEGVDIKNAQQDYENAVGVTEKSAQQYKNGNDVVPVWSTETGWPNKGDKDGSAVADVDHAQTYYKDVGCGYLFKNQRNAWWFDFYGVGSGVDSGISWGVADANGKPLFDLTC